MPDMHDGVVENPESSGLPLHGGKTRTGFSEAAMKVRNSRRIRIHGGKRFRSAIMYSFVGV
jgi:hypothetical protein